MTPIRSIRSLHRAHTSPRKASIAAIATVFAVVAALIVTAMTGIAGVSAASVGYNLGAASTYAVLAGTALTSDGKNTLAGTAGTDVGVFPSSTMTALEVSISGHGAINLGNPAAGAAQTDAQRAYLALRDAGPITYIPGELGSTIIPPGIYTPDVTDAAITMNTSFTLDGQGLSDPVWVFTTNAAASTAAGITMNLINGAEAANVYWAVGAAFSTGAGATVVGHFLAAGAITLGAATTIDGQLLGLALAPVTISDGARITNTTSSSAPNTLWVDETLGAIRSGVPYGDGVSVASSDGITFAPSEVSFQVTAGTLPAGLTLNATTGTVTGTATGSGASTWTIAARIQSHASISKTFTMTVSPGIQPFVDLGTAGTHAIIGNTNVTNVGVTTISGTAGTDVAVRLGPIVGGSNLNGVGTSNIGNTAYTTAHNDLVAAMTYANGLTAAPIPATLAGLTLTPGVYENAAALGFTGELVLNAMGNPDGVFIIRTPAALVSAGSATVTLMNGAQACNVYWVVGAAVTLGGANNFSGHIMAAFGATIGDGTVVNGQVLTATMAIVLANNIIVNDGCAPSGLFSIDGGAEATTTDSSPTISGVSDADPDSPVTVTVDGQTLSTTVTAAGTWTVTLATLVGTTFTVSAAVRNLAGGSNKATQTLTLTLDTTAPTLTINGGATAISGDTTPTISGTSNAIGETVTVTIGTQTLTTTVDADGNWAVITTTLTAGDHTISASVSDAVGNTTTTTQTLTLDTTAPTLTIDGGAENSTSTSTPTVSGTSSAIGRTVTVTIGGQTLTATVTSSGTWSVVAVTLDRGVYRLEASVTDGFDRTISAYQSLDYLSVQPIVIHNTTAAQTVHHGMRDAITVSGDGFVPGERVQIWLHSSPVLLGTLIADESGHISGLVRDAATTPLGIHHVVLIGAISGTSNDSFDVTVIAAVPVLATTGFPAGSALWLALLMLLGGAVVLIYTGAQKNGARRIPLPR